jgi:hypothetical protein
MFVASYSIREENKSETMNSVYSSSYYISLKSAGSGYGRFQLNAENIISRMHDRHGTYMRLLST